MNTPKMIHYVWVGNAPKPPIVQYCIESWKKFCPGWEIREWGNELVEQHGNRYAKEAYAHKKWAFVADWARLYVLYTYGGIYLDTDMEILKPIDEFLQNQFTMGFVERHGNVIYNGGFIGCQKESPILKGLLAQYDNIPFVMPNGELDQTPNTNRMVEYFLKKWNLNPKTAHETVTLDEGITIYPHNFFLSKEGYTYHHYCASWLDTWFRKVWLQIGPYKIVRFKRRPELTSGELKLIEGERMIGSFRLGKRKCVALIKSVQQVKSVN